MAFGLPKAGEITAQLNAKFDEMMQILREMLAVLQEIKAQRGPQ